ncbi:uncharacterized protein FIBRA_04936 [Fibroporia radiculosa]|uniref:Ribosomal protein L19 n=1 Tax=Fibroporia radiculosa TaxID=599839 RepID=J4H383_9APHY|nr:uncharacterized protein FIBRA_04936 [Fibroporia radiculosa]CCM02824.1 predicted protein [Fibroporia radiculosa]
MGLADVRYLLFDRSVVYNLGKCPSDTRSLLLLMVLASPPSHLSIQFTRPLRKTAPESVTRNSSRDVTRVTFRRFVTSNPNLTRALSTAAQPYPFSTAAKIPPPPANPLPESLRQGKGLMQYLTQTLPSPEKQNLLSTYFSRRHPLRVLPGSVLTVTLGHAPTTFSGVLMSVRRRGLDTSFVLRNVINRTGVEMQFFVSSPHLRNIKVLQRAGGGGGKAGRRMRRAKLFYLRDSPEKMTAISAGVRG